MLEVSKLLVAIPQGAMARITHQLTHIWTNNEGQNPAGSMYKWAGSWGRDTHVLVGNPATLATWQCRGSPPRRIMQAKRCQRGVPSGPVPPHQPQKGIRFRPHMCMPQLAKTPAQQYQITPNNSGESSSIVYAYTHANS